MRHCIEFRSGGRKRLRGVRGVHGSCCGATNGGCDGLGESLVETPGSAAGWLPRIEGMLRGGGLRRSILLYKHAHGNACADIG